MMTKQAELKKQAYESALKSRALSVLIYLIDRSNKELTCFPAIPTMAKHLHISISTVKRALHELENSGYIKKEARFRDKNKGQTSNLYTLVLLECPITLDEKESLESNEYERHAEAMEVETTEVSQGNEVSREKCQVEHISFDIIRTHKAENRECRVPCAFEQNIAFSIPDQDTERLSLIENGSKGIFLYLWTGAGVSLAPP